MKLEQFLIILISIWHPIKSATFENISVELRWKSGSNEDPKIIRIKSDANLTSYVGDFGDVRIHNQKIPTLPKFSVSNLPKVTHLELTTCQISSIETGAFGNIPLLNELNLSGNLLQQIENGVFSNLPFRTLDLSRNQIAQIANHALGNLKMESLFLDQNRLKEWKSDWFANTDLRTISVSYNQIEELPKLAFEYLWHFEKEAALTRFNVANNRLWFIDLKAFEGVKAIGTLDLRNNYLTRLEPGLFVTVQSIDSVDLSNNQLNEVYWEVFRGAKLNQINLDNNFLRCLPRDFFTRSELKKLEIRNNRISCDCVKEWSENQHPDISDLEKLQELCKNGASWIFTPLLLIAVIESLIFL